MTEPVRPRFAERTRADTADVARANPLAWLTSFVDGRHLASPLPLVPVVGGDGAVESFIGHIARANPQRAMLEAEPRALVLLMGPHGYVSPSWMRDRSQAPTWNFASTSFSVEVRMKPGRDAAHAAISLLVEAMEARRPSRWRIEEMGERYERLLAGVVAFEATVVDTRARFKLGQDERDDVYADILQGLSAHGNAPLVEWMRRFNPERPRELAPEVDSP
ncbi:MAG: FMN-binding negative transcriptional regulator [Luteimonas sp.]|nr:FMN-binding negative transcriptional regulator [Luteimonas sp.]